MSFEVKYAKQAVKQLRKLDNYTRTMILRWITKNLVETDDPRQHGKESKGNYKGMWRYRIGDYRVISLIQDDKMMILVIEIGHRRDVYK